MRPEIINVMHLKNGMWRVWVEGHAARAITANSKAEAVGLLALHYPDSLGVQFINKEST